MSTVLNVERTHQHLIDARLDAIERMLLEGRVSRGERAEIIEAVETQIHDMLDLEEGGASRDDVLRVLRSLDPPEAYCADEAYEFATQSRRTFRPAADFTRRTGTSVPPSGSGEQTVGRRVAPMAITALVLGLLSIPTVIVLPLGSLFAMAAAVCGVIAVGQIAGSQGRRSGLWMAIFACVMMGLHHFVVWAVVFFM